MSDTVCNLLLIGSCALACILFLWRPKLGAFAYLVAVVLVPQGHLGTWTPRPEQVLIIPMAATGLFRLTRRPTLMPGALQSFIWWVVWTLIVALLSDFQVDLLGLGGALRAIGVAWLFSQICWDRADLLRAQVLFVLLAIPVCLLSIGQVLGIPFARSVTEAAYTPWTSTVFFDQLAVEAFGAPVRAIGPFGSPASCGTYFALALTICIYLLSRRLPMGRRTNLGLITVLVVCMLGGLATQSGSFLAGTIIMLLACTVVARGIRRPLLVGLVVCMLLVFAGSLVLAMSKAEQISGNLTYQVDNFLNGTRLDNRYTSQDSVAVAAWKDIATHPLAGVGAIKKGEYSLMDSLYVTTLTQSGFLGSLFFFIPVLAIGWKAWRTGYDADSSVTLWTLAILATGIASDAMFAARIGDWWWALQGMFLSIAMQKPKQSMEPSFRPSEGPSLSSLRPALE